MNGLSIWKLIMTDVAALIIDKRLFLQYVDMRRKLSKMFIKGYRLLDSKVYKRQTLIKMVSLLENSV